MPGLLRLLRKMGKSGQSGGKEGLLKGAARDSPRRGSASDPWLRV